MQIVRCHNVCPPSLIKQASNIRQTCPDEQAIRYDIKKWAAYIGSWPEFAAVANRFPNSISRADLRLLGSEAIPDNSLLMQLFIATMVFGFGNVGYGPYRTSIMLEGLKTKPHLLRTTRDYLVEGEFVAAHGAFNLQMCRTPFLSKFFYALGLGAGLNPAPLILDNRVYKALDILHCRREINQWRYYTRSNWTSDGYSNYVHDMNAWARTLNCSADQIEMYLFQHGANVS